MPVPRKRALDLALSLENATSYPHFERVAVRTPRRTFATFALRGDDVNFAFDLALQEHFCALAPHAIAPVAGGWGRMGWTSCDLNAVDLATFKAALLAAHARSNVPPARRPRGGAAVTRDASSPSSRKASSRGARAAHRDDDREESPLRASKGRASLSRAQSEKGGEAPKKRAQSEKGGEAPKKRAAQSAGSSPAASVANAQPSATAAASTAKQRTSSEKVRQMPRKQRRQ